MKLICISLICGIFLISCHTEQVRIVNKQYVDSLLRHYNVLSLARTNGIEMQFWKSKIDPAKPGWVNEGNYANALLTRFHLFGDIRDLSRADSLIRRVNEQFGKEEKGLTLTLAGYSLIRRRFKEAGEWIQSAKVQG
jgi:hypothetical protein